MGALRGPCGAMGMLGIAPCALVVIIPGLAVDLIPGLAVDLIPGLAVDLILGTVGGGLGTVGTVGGGVACLGPHEFQSFITGATAEYGAYVVYLINGEGSASLGLAAVGVGL